MYIVLMVTLCDGVSRAMQHFGLYKILALSIWLLNMFESLSGGICLLACQSSSEILKLVEESKQQFRLTIPMLDSACLSLLVIQEFTIALLTFENNVFLQPQGIGSPSVYHAVIVIFLEFFAWGLLTAPTLVVSNL